MICLKHAFLMHMERFIGNFISAKVHTEFKIGINKLGFQIADRNWDYFGSYNLSVSPAAIHLLQTLHAALFSCQNKILLQSIWNKKQKNKN